MSGASSWVCQVVLFDDNLLYGMHSRGRVILHIYGLESLCASL